MPVGLRLFQTVLEHPEFCGTLNYGALLRELVWKRAQAPLKANRYSIIENSLISGLVCQRSQSRPYLLHGRADEFSQELPGRALILIFDDLNMKRDSPLPVGAGARLRAGDRR